MFHYPSELSHWWGRRGGGSDRVAVERRDWPRFAANHRIVATCRILSQSAVIGRETSSSAQGKKIDVPKPPRHFLISRGPSWGFVKIASERLLSRRCSAIPLQSMESFRESTVSRSQTPRWPRQTFLSGNPFAIPLSVETVFCARTSLFSGDRKILSSRDPLAISFICDSGRHRDGRAERIFVPKGLGHCLLGREGVFCVWIT